MAGEHLEFQARRVISSVDANGKSTIVTDENTITRTATPGFTVADVWRLDALPAHVDDTLTGTVDLSPPPNGVVVRLTTFPPDSEWDPSVGYGEALVALNAGDAHVAGEDSDPGMHTTETIDIVTMVSGELYAVLEDTETLLRPGDTFIQRGTKHSWSNRTDKPATFVATMMPAKR
jgi:hypothetical protein